MLCRLGLDRDCWKRHSCSAAGNAGERDLLVLENRLHWARGSRVHVLERHLRLLQRGDRRGLAAAQQAEDALSFHAEKEEQELQVAQY